MAKADTKTKSEVGIDKSGLGGLEALDFGDSKLVEVVSPAGVPIGVRITIASPYHPSIQQHEKDTRLELQQYMRNIGNPRRLSITQRQQLMEMQERQVGDRLVCSTLGWDSDEFPGASPGMGGQVVWRGQAYPCTPQNVKKLYDELPYLKDFVSAELLDQVGFTKNLASS